MLNAISNFTDDLGWKIEQFVETSLEIFKDKRNAEEALRRAEYKLQDAKWENNGGTQHFSAAADVHHFRLDLADAKEEANIRKNVIVAFIGAAFLATGIIGAAAGVAIKGALAPQYSSNSGCASVKVPAP